MFSQTTVPELRAVASPSWGVLLRVAVRGPPFWLVPGFLGLPSGMASGSLWFGFWSLWFGFWSSLACFPVVVESEEEQQTEDFSVCECLYTPNSFA